MRIAGARTLGFAVFAALCVIRALLLGIAPLGQSWCDILVCGIGLLATVAILGERLPFQNWGAVMALVGVLGGGLEWVAREEPHIVWMAALWTMGLLNARGTAARLLCRWRKSRNYGFWLIGIAGLLSALLLSAAETARAPENKFLWGAFLIRIFAAWAMLAAAAPLLISKRPAPEAVEWQSMGCWLALTTLMACAAAGQQQWGMFWVMIMVAGIVVIWGWLNCSAILEAHFGVGLY